LLLSFRQQSHHNELDSDKMIAEAHIHTRQARARLLIDEIVHRLGLDLSGMVVLTEMASGQYVYTPLIAALAGASRVLAVVKDSEYGPIEEIISRGRTLAGLWGVHDHIEVVHALSASVIAQADIITNLGSVRPIDALFISHMKPGAVIPYMREAWEYRPEEVDLAECRERNIPVMGTFENYDDLGIFDFCGPLAVKMLLESGIEVKDDYIVVVSRDNFGDVISAYLRACGARVQHVREAAQLDVGWVGRVDALLVACYRTDELIVGPGGWFEPATLAQYHPECTVVQFVGKVDAESLAMQRMRCVPDFTVGPHRMAQTLAVLGPRPVIDLHAAGLKVGELMCRKMRVIQDAGQVERALAGEHALCQCLPKMS
jgi:hypothetical protein